jgi:hypothetical protein
MLGNGDGDRVVDGVVVEVDFEQHWQQRRMMSWETRRACRQQAYTNSKGRSPSPPKWTIAEWSTSVVFGVVVACVLEFELLDELV